MNDKQLNDLVDDVEKIEYYESWREEDDNWMDSDYGEVYTPNWEASEC